MAGEEAKFVRYEYTDGAVVTQQWLTMLDGIWPYKDEKTHVVKVDYPLYNETRII
jgi:hypothetical protein